MGRIRTGRLAMGVLAMGALLSFTLPLFANSEQGGYRLLQLDGYKVKWGEQTLGAGASISYAFATETMRFDGAHNCADLAPMDDLSGPDLSFEIFQRETAAAFRVWERAADLSFHQIDDPGRADIVIGAQGQPTGHAFANVSHAPGSRNGVRRINQALVCLNPERQWKVGFDGNTKVLDIRYIMIHEIGHAVGLDHPGPDGQLMGFRYTESFAGLQPGDLRGIRQLYGPAARDQQLAATESNTRVLVTPPVLDSAETSTSNSID